jgi:hypothetical protein
MRSVGQFLVDSVFSVGGDFERDDQLDSFPALILEGKGINFLDGRVALGR